jgi:hypothetical protein
VPDAVDVVPLLDVALGDDELDGSFDDGAAVGLGDGRGGMQPATASSVAAVNVTSRMRPVTPARDA